MARKPANRNLEEEEITTALAELRAREDNQTGEQWKLFVLGFFVSNYGRVWNYCTRTMIHCYFHDKSRGDFHMCWDIADGKSVYLHRAVYFLFGDTAALKYPFAIVDDKSKWIIHHISNDPTDNHISNLYLMLDKWHGKLNMELLHKKIKQSDVDTREKLDRWLLLHTDALQWFTDDKNK